MLWYKNFENELAIVNLKYVWSENEENRFNRR